MHRRKLMAQSGCDVLKVALEHVAKHFSDYDVTGMETIVSESGDLREVTFLLPLDALGGAPVVIVDMGTCTVVRSYMTQ
jgi:hypothetical protein